MTRLVAAASVTLLALSVTASDAIVVEKGSPRTQTDSLSFSSLTLHDSFTASGSAVLTPDSGAVIDLAPDAGDTATFTLSGSAKFASGSGRTSTLRFGKGTGLVSVEMTGSATESAKIEIPSVGETDDGETTARRIIELKSGSFSTYSITNSSARPVEILFAGGTLSLANYAGTTFFASEESPVVLRGSATASIDLGPGWFPWYLAGVADRSVATAGDCDLTFSRVDRGADNWGRIWLNRPIAWGHTGTTRFTGVSCRTDKDDVLPHGAGLGGLVFATHSYQVYQGYPYTAILDLNGTTQTVNSLDVSSGSFVTNSSSKVKVACLQFGADDTDGMFTGIAASSVTVRKIGAGTLTLKDATVTAPTAVAGSLTISGTTTVRGFGDFVDLTPVLIEKAPSTIPDGYTNAYHERYGGSPKTVMEASGLLAATAKAVSVPADATLVVESAADEAVERFVAIDAKGAFVKTGAGALSVRGSEACPQTFSGLVRAAEGRLALSGMGLTNAYWRLSISKTIKDNFPALSLVEFGLFDVDGNRVNQGTYAFNAAGKDASALAEKEITCTAGLAFGTRSDGNPKDPHYILNGTWWDSLDVTGMEDGYETPAAVVFTFRLPAGTAPVHSYAFCANGPIPTTWTIETSPDGVNWTTADSRADFYTGKFSWDYAYYYWHLDNRWGNVSGLPLTFAAADEASASVTVDGAWLRADAGATLDVGGASGTPAGVEVDATAPGGAIAGLKSAQGLTLRIVNLPDGQTRASLAEVANLVTLSGGVTAEDLATWHVTVNGRATRMKAKMDGAGRVSVASPGLALIIR